MNLKHIYVEGTGYTPISEKYATWLDTLGYSASFISGCKYSILLFFDWLYERKKYIAIKQLTAKDITDYYQHLELRPNKHNSNFLLSDTALNSNYMAIDKLLEFLRQYGLSTAPFPTYKRIKIDRQQQIDKIEVLTQAEVKMLYDTISETYQNLPVAERLSKRYELKLLLALYYGCGLRWSEGFNLKIQDVDFNKRTIFVEQGKNYKDRYVPMSGDVYRDLQDYVHNYRCVLRVSHSRLFVCSKGTLPNKLKYLQSVCEDQELKAKNLHLHLLRHSIATHLLQNGMEIEKIGQFLGHSSLESTQIYTHFI